MRVALSCPFLSAVLSVAACSSFGGEQQAGVACAAHLECDTGAACVAGQCVTVTPPADASEADIQIWAEILPPTDELQLAQTLTTGLNDGAQKTLTLTTAAELQGSFTGALAGDLAGTLVVEEEGVLPGRSISFSGIVSGGAFAFNVLPDRTYTPRFLPNPGLTDTLPPRIFVPSEADLTSGLGAQLAYFETNDLLTIRGSLFWTDASSPIGEARVTAHTRNAVGDLTPGTVVRTDEETGAFTLLVPNRGADVVVEVRQDASFGGNPSVPSVTFPARTLPTDGNLGAFLIGVPPTPRRVRLTVRAPDGSPVPGARILATGDAGVGSFSANETTDVGGLARLDLLDGTFELRILPEPRGGLSPSRVSVVIDGNDVQTTTYVEQQFFVEGYVEHQDGSPVANARVTAQTEAASSGRKLATTSDGTGWYRLGIDRNANPTLWIFTIEAPVGARLPTWRREIELESSDQVLDFAIPTGSIVYGTVNDNDGVPVAAAILNLYQASDPESVLIGSGSTSESGEFAIPVAVQTSP